MKVLSLFLKSISVLMMLFALLAFGSDLLPVEGISFGGYESDDGLHQFYKVVPTDGVNPMLVGFGLVFSSIALSVMAVLITKRSDNASGT